MALIPGSLAHFEGWYPVEPAGEREGDISQNKLTDSRISGERGISTNRPSLR